MKTKFETNVALETPKTKLEEPKLPWKVTDEELERQGAGLFKTRAIFPIVLFLVAFGILAYLILDAVIKSENMRLTMASKEKEVSLLRQDFGKIAGEKAALGESKAQLEKRVNELSAQKELFKAVIESLTKKGDELE